MGLSLILRCVFFLVFFVSRPLLGNETRVVVVPLEGESIVVAGEFLGKWQPGTAYDVSDLVELAGSSYICTTAHTSDTGNFPPDNLFWRIFAASGVDGVQGPQGEQGISGVQGPRGSQGPRGPQGERGQRGNDGLPGAIGAQGPQGEQGEQGVEGIQGSNGEQGLRGERGLTGAVGPQGSPGVRGAVGSVGPKGDQGTEGARGPIGLTGASGPVGPATTTVAICSSCGVCQCDVRRVAYLEVSASGRSCNATSDTGECSATLNTSGSNPSCRPGQLATCCVCASN